MIIHEELANFYTVKDQIWKSLYNMRISMSTMDVDKEEIQKQAQVLKAKFEEAYSKAEPYMDDGRRYSHEIATMRRVLTEYASKTDIEDLSI